MSAVNRILLLQWFHLHYEYPLYLPVSRLLTYVITFQGRVWTEGTQDTFQVSYYLFLLVLIPTKQTVRMNESV